MIRNYQSIIGTYIVSEEDGGTLGLLYDIIIHPDTGKVEAFWVKPTTIPISNAILQTDDIISWKKKIYIRDESKIAMAEDFIRISELLNRNVLFIDNRAINQDETELGIIYDLSFEDKTYYLKNIYTHKLFLFFGFQKRIYSFDSILKSTTDAIWINDDSSKKDPVVSINKKTEPAL